MKRIFSFLLGITAFLSVNAADLTLADPTIFYENGVYYLTGTYASNGFAMYSSTDLVHWKACGNAGSGLALLKGDTYGTSGFWAPQIFKYGDSYYMAYTANEQIAVAKGDSPMGPFKQTKLACLSGTTGQIDPFIFIDDDGKKYIFYVRFIGGNTLYVAEMNDDFSAIKDETITRCLGAESGWESMNHITTTPITEGPTMFKDGGYYYLVYSANHFEDIDYAVGYAYSTSPKGPWTKVGRPFISRHSIGINGTGHGDLFQDAEGNWYYVFHVHASNTQVQTRRTAIVPITITDDPTNKFVPQVDRTLILTSNATSSMQFPTALEAFEVDGIQYAINNATRKSLQVNCKDPVRFGGYEGEITIPETVEYNGEEYSVKVINDGAFYNCPDLKRVNLPSSVTKIGVGAFEKSGIRSIEIPSGVTSIGYLAFKDCSNLLDVVENRSTPLNIGDATFPDATYTDGKLWVPEGSESKYEAKAPWSNFSRISNVEKGSLKYDFCVDGVFYKTTSGDKGTVKTASRTGEWAAYRGPEVIVPAVVEYEGKTYDVTEVGMGTFYSSRLVEKVHLPEGITTISSSSFYNCFALTELTIPSTVKSLGSSVCRNCESLVKVTCLAQTPPTASDSDFPDATYAQTLYVPAGTKALYSEATCWKKFKNIVELEDTGIEVVDEKKVTDNTLYNITGQKVDENYRGVVVRNGKKYLQK